MGGARLRALANRRVVWIGNGQRINFSRQLKGVDGAGDEDQRPVGLPMAHVGDAKPASQRSPTDAAGPLRLYGAVFGRLKRGVRWIARPLGAVLLGAFVLHDLFPELAPNILRLSLGETLIVALLLLLVERVVIVEQLVSTELERRRRTWVHARRKDAYAHLAGLIRERGVTVHTVDLLQFSGVTARPVIEEVARSCPGARVRLLIATTASADAYDEPMFHRRRIEQTLQDLAVLFEDGPNITVDVATYGSVAGMSGVLVDNDLVVAGWYHVFPRAAVAVGQSIRGHVTPAITAADAAAEPLASMVRKQFDAVWAGAAPILELGPGRQLGPSAVDVAVGWEDRVPHDA